jgi:rhodanese-related sulfurtransferase
MTDTAITSPVTAHPAAEADVARVHFAARLAVETDVADVAAALEAGSPDFVVVDARSRESYAAGHLPGALNLPHAEIDADAVAQLPDGLVVAYCWGPGCNGAHKAAVKLAAHGRRVKEMLGGFDYWVREHGPVEKGERAN